MYYKYLKKIITITICLLTIFNLIAAELNREVKTVGIVIIETGDEDGVWLESIKQIHILKARGIDVKIITGKHHGTIVNGYIEVPGPIANGPTIKVKIEVEPELTPRAGVAKEIFEQGFEPNIRPSQVSKLEELAMKNKLDRATDELFKIVNRWITNEGIDLFISQNANAIPMHLPLGVALAKIANIRDDVLSIFHNHDFPWERGDKYLGTPYKCLLNAVKKYFPGKTETTQHLVINKHNLSEIERRLGLKGAVLPNVMNFADKNFGKLDDYNNDLLKTLNIPDNALLLGQVTRVVERKNIEASIEILKKISEQRGDKRVHLIISGEESIGDKSGYKDRLVELIKQYNLEDQVTWASDFIAPKRGQIDGRKVYSLSDLYAHLATKGMMTYPSTYEGFGNAFVEAVLAKVPIIVNNYEPVYMPELGNLGFHTVQMENGLVTDNTVKDVNTYLFHIETIIDYNNSGNANLAKSREYINKRTSANFELGKKHLSYETADEIITDGVNGAIEKGNRLKNTNFIKLKKSKINSSLKSSKLCNKTLSILLVN